MEIREENTGNVCRLAVSGRLTADCAETFKHAVADAVSLHSMILLDLAEMEYIDSTGLGALVFAMQKVSDKGGKLKLAALGAKVRIVFDITKAYKVFDIYETVEEAAAFEDAGA